VLNGDEMHIGSTWRTVIEPSVCGGDAALCQINFDHLNDIVHISVLQKGLDSLSDWSKMALKISI